MKNPSIFTLRKSPKMWIGKLSILFLVATLFGAETESIGARPIDSPPPQNGPILTYYIDGGRYLTSGTSYNAPITKHTIRVNHYSSGSTSNPKGILCIHGFGDNSSIFAPMAHRLLATGKATDVYAVDLPGHGGSWLSTYALFGPPVYGELDMIEYTNVIQELLEQMKGERKNINTIVGHSLGGLIIQLLQDRLLYESSSLLVRFGIQNTVLIASDIPSPLPWYGGDAPISDPYSAKALVVGFRVNSTNALIGSYVDTPDSFFISSKYAVNNVPVSGAPSAADLSKLKNREPYASAANVVGLDPSGLTNNAVSRMSVRRNIWNGFNLKVAWLDKDPFFSQSESAGLADYLKAGLPLTIISDSEAVHGAPYSKPDLLIPLF
ncbi:alpha/beta hydrolase [Leptospira yasudae]|uniref:alpha/beta hydrolase n=1 Tax=Leptospira yasudae TaxID=2202201 RepID=UPI001091296D|nr:alpha/beta hydrolase [Leptospira yasudae]TGN01608.1 alpha/beta hydrolase [Leptospira yasudae]